jgi:hypothetical protein
LAVLDGGLFKFVGRDFKFVGRDFEVDFDGFLFGGVLVIF